MTSPAASVSIRAAVVQVRARIAAACDRADRDPSSITLVAVTKTRPATDIAEAYRAGIRDFGENYVQEGIPKFRESAAMLSGTSESPPFIRHFIGHLQRNKVHDAVDAFDVVHGIDSMRLLEAIGHRASRNVPAFLQVNLAGEASKSGATPADVPALVARARLLDGIALLGLMTIPPPGTPEDSRPWFRALRQLAHANGLPHLSMGMTDDFEVAIEEGATHIRVGRALFGERQL